MEKILVGIDPQKTNIWAGIHALNLAKRTGAKVSFLLIIDPKSRELGQDSETEIRAAMEEKIEPLIEGARSEGIAVDYYLAYGSYETELVKFVQENKITLLVVEAPSGKEKSAERFSEFLEKIRHRLNCRIEIVHQKI